MISEIVYTETYKITLAELVKNLEAGYGLSVVDRFFDRIDDIVQKIKKSPYLFQAIPVDTRFRRVVISPQSSLVYEVTESKIILLYIFDNRQDPMWTQ